MNVKVDYNCEGYQELSNISLQNFVKGYNLLMLKSSTIPFRNTKFLIILSIIGITLLNSGCSLITKSVESTELPLTTSVVSPTPFQPETISIAISESVPASWITEISRLGNLQISGTNIDDGLLLSQKASSEDEIEYGKFARVYAAVVPFPTITDEISIEQLKGLWNGSKTDLFDQLILSGDTEKTLIELWGNAPSDNVLILDSNTVLDSAWKSSTSIAIIPFEEISPRWKVLRVDQISPLDKPMNLTGYPLTILYHLIGKNANESSERNLAEQIVGIIPASNRDESKMTVVVMSGTTALVRTTAYKIEHRGTDYPISDIKNWFLSADIRHVSNEISMNKDCPDPDPFDNRLVFCTSEKYLPVLQGLGINVVELTGNHLNDYGSEKLVETLQIYKQNNLNYFGGGLNLEDAQKPLEMVSNGNKFAFIGCNVAGPVSDFATENSAGSAPCDMNYYNSEISRLKSEGYVIFATFQDSERYVYMPDPTYRVAYLQAAEAGADIVQGSQAHFPMGFQFSGNSFIHFGLGNFLFDQMDYPVVGTTREFIDRHIVYDGKYINTELLTALLTDWSKPIPMTIEQRSQFLKDIFDASKLR
jgi:poly-gamma-glutamate synthesis protein (capsule biosynthesis protein)